MTYGRWNYNGHFDGRISQYMDRDLEEPDSVFVWWSSGASSTDMLKLPKGWWCSVENVPAEKCVGPFPTMHVAKAMALLLPKAEE